MNNDEKLIELVKAHRAIYDKTDVFYSNKDYVKELWQEIAKEMNQTVPVCQKRWRYLRDYFVRQLHMTQNQNVRQNGGVSTVTTATTAATAATTTTSITSTGTTTTTTTATTTTSESLASSSPPMINTTAATTAAVQNNSSNSYNSTNNSMNSKKKTFWAFYDKMLFLKPFSSTRKSKPKVFNRRQSQGHLRKKSTASGADMDQNSTVHTISDSNSADDEFDSFEYMTMYQMQFGTEADKAELQCNGSIHNMILNDDITAALQQQQQQIIAQQSSIDQQQQQQNDSMTTMTTFIEETQKQQQQQQPIKIIFKSNSITPTEYIQNTLGTAPAAAAAVVAVATSSTVPGTVTITPSSSSSPSSSISPMKIMQQQQQLQQQTDKVSDAEAGASISASASASKPPPAKKRKRSEICEEILEILKKTDDDTERDDEHSMFFKSLLNSVRKIDEEHILAFRTEVIQIIMKYRYMSQQSNNDRNGSNSDVVVVDTGEMHWRHKLPC